MRNTRFLIYALIICLLLTGCNTDNKRILYSSDKLHVIRDGKNTVIQDIAGGRTYVLRTIRVRKTEAKPEPRTLVDTDSLKIICDGGLTTIKADGVILTISKGKRSH